MATLAVQTISRAGVNPTYAAAGGGGDNFVNTGIEFIAIKNGDSGAHVVTVIAEATVDGLTVANRTVSIPAGQERIIGPFPTGVYSDTNSKVQLTYDGVTSVTIAVLAPGS